MPPSEIIAKPTFESPRHMLFFDQFGVTRKSGIYEIHFGSKTGAIGLIAIIAEGVFQRNRDNFLSYLNEIGLPETAHESGFRIREPREVVFADTVGVARHEEIAELTLHAFSWKLVVDKSREKTKSKEPIPIETVFVAMLRSTVETQRNLIDAIYENDEA